MAAAFSEFIAFATVSLWSKIQSAVRYLHDRLDIPPTKKAASQ